MKKMVWYLFILMFGVLCASAQEKQFQMLYGSVSGYAIEVSIKDSGIALTVSGVIGEDLEGLSGCLFWESLRLSANNEIISLGETPYYLLWRSGEPVWDISYFEQESGNYLVVIQTTSHLHLKIEGCVVLVDGPKNNEKEAPIVALFKNFD